MKGFDKYIYDITSRDEQEIPPAVEDKIDCILAQLPPMEEKRKNLFSSKRGPWTKVLRPVSYAALSLAIFFGVLPNVSSSYAQAVSRIPLVGEIVKVFTAEEIIIDYDKKEVEIKIPQIRNDKDSESIEIVNSDIDSMVNTVMKKFYQEAAFPGGSSYGSLNVSYEVITNSDTWFTLKLTVYEIAASSNSYFKYYSIDKESGQIVSLGDLLIKGGEELIYKDIVLQMKEQLENNEQKSYFIGNTDTNDGFTALDENHNYYFNESGELVIPFDKYEVAPGFMGCPEFVISPQITKEALKKYN